ncbi:MAG: class I SAM-dependent methyltransferase, partial [Anaerolineae bacterium]|nr:class I SAM-dependent methyltransferase [Anaerolineae bacterium]
MPSDSITFDHAAGFYDQTRGFPPEQEPHIAPLFVAAGKLAPASHVLEAGVGTGRIALLIAPHVARIAGIDLARPMLDKLRAKRTGERVAVLETDATRLPFRTGIFDAAVSAHIFHLIPTWRDALHEVARVLRPGGVLLNAWNDNQRRNADQDVLFNVWAAASGLGQLENVGVPRAQYGTFLADSGWRQTSKRHTHTFVRARSTRDFIARLENRIWSSTWRLSEDAHARGIAAVRAAADAQAIDLDAPVAFDVSFNVEAY